jgi:hypothetical protein
VSAVADTFERCMLLGRYGLELLILRAQPDCSGSLKYELGLKERVSNNSLVLARYVISYIGTDKGNENAYRPSTYQFSSSYMRL